MLKKMDGHGSESLSYGIPHGFGSPLTLRMIGFKVGGGGMGKTR